MRKIVALLIAVMPFSVVRIFFYRLFLGYKISYSSHIGCLNFLHCRYCEINGAKMGILNRISCEKLYMSKSSSIKHKNKIFLVKDFILDEKAEICSSNNFIGGFTTALPYKEYSNFKLGKKSLIASSHYFDVTDMVTIGNNVVFGGIHSKVWTHGFDVDRTMIQAPVTIDSNIYIGSDVIICQGVCITDNTVIGTGTVVSKNISESGFYVSGQLIRKSETPSYTAMQNVQCYEGGKFYRKSK